MAYDDDDLDELRRRVTSLVRQNDLLVLRNALLIAAGDKLAATADAQCREVVSFALHDAVAAWRTACAAHADDARLAGRCKTCGSFDRSHRAAVALPGSESFARLCSDAWHTAAIADAEQRGYERGLANRDERCLQSDMQRIREKLAFERGRKTERAEVVGYLYSSGAAGSARAIETGSHLAKEE